MDNIGEDMQLANFITPNRNWNQERLADLFEAEMMNQIMNIPIAPGLWTDQLLWYQTKLSQVVLQDMYALLDHPQYPVPNFNSNWV